MHRSVLKVGYVGFEKDGSLSSVNQRDCNKVYCRKRSHLSGWYNYEHLRKYSH